MAYNKTIWHNDQPPALNAENLNNIENGVSYVDEQLEALNSVNLLFGKLTKSSYTTGGITWQWNAAKTECTVTGVRTSDTVQPLYAKAPLIAGIEAGRSYSVHFSTNNTGVYLSFVFYNSANTATYVTVKQNKIINVPADAVQMAVRIYYNANTDLNTNPAVVTDPIVCSAPSNADLYETIMSNAYLNKNPNANFITGMTYFYDPAYTSANKMSPADFPVNTYTYTLADRLTGFPSEITDSMNVWVFSFANMWNNAVRTYWVHDSRSEVFFRGISTNSGASVTWINANKYDLTPNVLTGTVDLNAVFDNGAYIITSSGTTVLHAPDGFTPTRLIAMQFSKTNKFGLQICQRWDTGESYTRMCDASGNWQAWNKIITDNDNAGGNPKPRMFSIGSSTFSGSVWRNGAFDHFADYNDTPYGCIANAIGVKRVNETHHLISSTGLLYNAGEGTFVNYITTNVNAADYDVIAVSIGVSDMGTANQAGTDAHGNPYRGYAIGSMSSAPGDGTIAGAVLQLLNQIRSQNKLCNLILVCSAPCWSQSGYSGDNVFTGTHPNGSTLTQLDELLHQLADREKFIYIDWEDFYAAKFYQEYTDGTNIHPNTDIMYRQMGGYLGGRASKELKY